MLKEDLVTPSPWQVLREHTPARIALGRAGGSLPTAAMIEFQLAHARARDAVHLPFDAAGVEGRLHEMGYAVLRVHSRAPERSGYLRRPDLGRRLDTPSRQRLTEFARSSSDRCAWDAAFVIADGLSALACHEHALEVLSRAHRVLCADGWRIAPIVVSELSRVALGDEIGELLGAQSVAMVIGERPGLSAADSLGIYLTFAPRVGRTDAERNCISNIRPDGLSYEQAAHRLVHLLREARRLKLTGIGLKDTSDDQALALADRAGLPER